MEFIPLEIPKAALGAGKKIKKCSLPESEKSVSKRRKTFKQLSLKNTKNKYKEKLAEKRVKKIQFIKDKRKKLKEKNLSHIKEKEEETENKDNNTPSNLYSNKGDSEENESNAESEKELDEEEKREKAKLEKWKLMDEKKKNRIFVKLKKSIYSEAQIKELHPDIRSVIFPRKKKSKWCWAVFVSEERANKAFPKLAQNKEIFVSKPNNYPVVQSKREKILEMQKRKANATKKLLDMWT